MAIVGRKQMNISASLVLFHQSPDVFKDVIESFLQSCTGDLYIIDNSLHPSDHPLFTRDQVHYFFVGENLGFGRAHNLALSKINWRSNIHFFLNPDVKFSPDVIPYLISNMLQDEGIGLTMPRVEYVDGSLQRLCKLLPNPIDLIVRRFIPAFMTKRLNARYELHSLPQDIASDIPSLSGCFLAARTSLLQKIGGFDERYFMYMEDVDLVRRMGDHARTVYNPAVKIIHGYAKGSYRDRKLLMLHLASAIKYFNKWGWFFDKTRNLRNKETLKKLPHQSRLEA